METITLPNFLICGAEKAGTTSLYEYLRTHPEICMSQQKEIHFFSQNFEKGVAWYSRHFLGCCGEMAIGEASPSYMKSRIAAQRIHTVLPEAKLLFILRDPVTRAYSYYWSKVSRGALSPRISFSEAIRKKKGPRRFVEPGFYMVQIERYLEYFDRSQLHFLLTEELTADPLRTLDSCFAFLQVSRDHAPNVGQRYNVTGIPRNRLTAAIARACFAGVQLSKAHIPQPVKCRTKPLWSAINRALLTNRPRPPMSEIDREFLKATYDPYNQRLANFLGRDLSEVWT